MLPHRLNNLIRGGGEPARVTVDFNFHVPRAVDDESGHVLEKDLELVRQIERFVVCDDAKGNVGFLKHLFT
jgi:hypothetical protein